MNRLHGLVVSVTLVAVLAACAPSPSHTATPEAKPKPTTSAAKPTASPTATPSATVAPAPAPAPLTLPDCETMLPIAMARDLFSENTEFLGEIAPADFVSRLSVPSLPAVLSAVSPARGCFWGVPQSDGLFQLVVAGIASGQRATLEGELAGNGYSSTTMGTVTGYDLEGMNEVGSTGTTHLFTGEVWIVCDGTSVGLSGAVAGAALDALRTANPTLGL